MIEIKLNCLCAAHREIELTAEIDLKKGVAYITTCPGCLQEIKQTQLKIITDKLLEFRDEEDITVIPHTRGKPRRSKKSSSQDVIYHCAGCNEVIMPGDPAITQTSEGKFFHLLCLSKEDKGG